MEYSNLLNVNTVFASDIVDEKRITDGKGRKKYTLADFYNQADLVTYPSTIEGFGNAFLEAVYYRVPLVVNNYSIYCFDIKPKGFRVIEIHDYVSQETIDHTRQVLENPGLASEMADKNYRLARRFFSYETLEQNLRSMLVQFFGSD